MPYRLVNITEQAVDLLIDQVMQAEHSCMCQKCRLDVMALALNTLPPKYVATEHGSTYETFRMSMMQNRVDIYQAIFEAIQHVKAHPRHEHTGDGFQ